jgi:hypothetical protein
LSFEVVVRRDEPGCDQSTPSLSDRSHRHVESRCDRTDIDVPLGCSPQYGQTDRIEAHSEEVRGFHTGEATAGHGDAPGM